MPYFSLVFQSKAKKAMNLKTRCKLVVKQKCNLLLQNKIFYYLLYIHVVKYQILLIIPSKVLVLSIPIYPHCHQSGPGPCHPIDNCNSSNPPFLNLRFSVLQLILHTALRLTSTPFSLYYLRTQNESLALRSDLNNFVLQDPLALIHSILSPFSTNLYPTN